MYNTQGLRGLTVAERQSWEKEQLSNIGADFTKYSEEHKDRLYRNQQFHSAFGKEDNYNELVKMSPVERDRYYADKVFYDTNKDKMSVEDMVKLSPEERDAQYEHAYRFNQAKELYGDTDVWSQVARKDAKGNEYSLFETETLRDLVNSGIKPEAEVKEYERAGILGNTYNRGQKERADSDLALASSIGDSPASNHAKRLFKKALGDLGAIATGVGTFAVDLFQDATHAVKWAAGEALSKQTLDFREWDKPNTEPTLRHGYRRNENGELEAVAEWEEPEFEWKTPSKVNGGFAAGDRAVALRDKISTSWLRSANEDAWAELRKADYNRKMEAGKEIIDRMASTLQNQAYLGGDKERAELDAQFKELMSSSPYFRQFKDTKYLRNLTYADKARMTAEALYMLGQYGQETYANFTNDNVRDYIADSMDTGDRLAHGAFDIYAQTLGGLAGYVLGQASIGTGIADAFSEDYDSNVFRQGFDKDGKQLTWWQNPVFWNSISQYGTTDWEEIKRIKYGIGEQAYQEYAAKKKEEDPNLTPQDIENMWIKEQWNEGRFRGDQVSKHTNVYNSTEENDIMSLSTFYGALGMSGQVLSQYLLGSGIGGLGNLMRNGAAAMKMARTAEAINTVTPYAKIALPTLPIAEAYAQGAYEKTVQGNRDLLEKYLQSGEGQEAVNKRFEANKEQYIDQALEMVRADFEANQEAFGDTNGGKLVINRESPYVLDYARALAAEDERKQFYGHLDEGAKAAFWTSFAIEGIRYGVFNMFNRQWIFGDASRKIRGIGPEVKMTAQGARPVIEGAWNTAKDVTKTAAKEMWNSGKTNYCDELTTGFAVGFGSNLPTDYMGRIRQNNPEFDGVYGALLNGFNNLVEVADDPTSIQAFTTGALGFLVGGNAANVATSFMMPSIKAEYSEEEKLERIKQGLAEGLSYEKAQRRAEMSSEEARELLKQKLGLTENNYSAGRHALEWASYLTGNSALQNVSERLQRLDDATRVANRINSQLAKDAQVLENDRVIREMSSLVAAREAASMSGDIMTKKNENFKDVFHTLKTLQLMRGRNTQDTSVYENFMETMRGYAEGRITDEDVQAFLHNPENEAYSSSLGNAEEQAAYAKDRIQKNAEKFLDMNESWQRNKQVIDSTLGDLSQAEDMDAQDYYYDLLFKMSWSEDAAKRLESMEESISGMKSSSEDETPMIQRLIATVGGNQEFVQGLYDSIQKHVSGLENQLAHQKRHINFISKNKRTKAETLQKQQVEADKIQAEIDRFKRLKDHYNETLTRYKEVSSEEAKAAESKFPIKAEELLHLNPEERLFVFTHADSFSKQQQKQIEKARTQLLKKMGNDYLTTLRDAHVLNQRVTLNDEYIARALTGNNVQEAIDAIKQTKANELVKTIQWLAGEKLRSIVPIVRSRVTKKLLSTLVGIPVQDARKYAPFIGDMNKTKVLNDALDILESVSQLDEAINLVTDNPAERRRATDLVEGLLFNAKNIVDVPKILQDFLNNNQENPDMQGDIELLEKVLLKSNELFQQKDSTQNNAKNVVKEEVKGEAQTGENGTPVSLEDQLIESHSDRTTGSFESLTAEEVDQIHPETAPVSTNNSGEVTESGSEAMAENVQGTTLQGNWINAYDVPQLRQTGKQVAKKGISKDSVFQRWLDWTAQNSLKLQDIVDYELARIVADNPNILVHTLVVKGDENATQDNLIRDAIMLVIEATDAVKKVHDESRGHYIQANGKEYLIIGRAGIEKEHTDAQESNYKAMHDAIQAEKAVYFEKNGGERFYISEKYATKVRYINGGNITKALIGEEETLHNIADMLGDEVRDPFGIGKLDDMGWYIQVGTESREPIGLPIKVVKAGDYYLPLDKERNKGAVFAMVPAGNGKYMPIKLYPATLDKINDGKFKDIVRSIAQRLASPDYETRENAIKEMLKLVVLNKGKNQILIGTKDIPAITIIQDGVAQPTMRLSEVPVEKVVEAIMQTPFRINITQTTFGDNVRMQQLAEAGALMTDAAVLGGTGNNFTVYAMDENGAPMIETANIGNQGYTPKNLVTAEVVYKGVTARMKGGNWIVSEIGKDSRVVKSPTEIMQLNCAYQIQEQALVPVESRDGYDYFILSTDKNNPLAVKKSRSTGEIIIPSTTAMLDFINKNEAKHRDLQAKIAKDAEEQEQLGGGVAFEIPIPEEEGQESEEQYKDNANNNSKTAEQESKENPTEVQRKVAEDTKKVTQNLHKSEKSFTFAELYDNPQYYPLIDDALVEKFGEKNIPDNPSPEWLQKHNLPSVGIENVEALLDLIKNCR